MPTYVRTCNDCAHHFEATVPMALSDSIRCPQCSSANLATDFAAQNPRCHGDEIHGTRAQLHDVRLCKREVEEGRKLFAGTGCTIADDGRVHAPTITAKRNWYRREDLIRRVSIDKREAGDAAPKKPVAVGAGQV